jgi:hypothetical protein
MSLMDSELQQGLSDLERDQSDDGTPPQFTWAGYVFPCVVSTKKRGSTVEIGGKVISFDFSIRVRLNAVATDETTVFSDVVQPLAGNQLIQDGTAYEIEFVDTAQGAFLTLMLVNPNGK